MFYYFPILLPPKRSFPLFLFILSISAVDTGLVLGAPASSYTAFVQLSSGTRQVAFVVLCWQQEIFCFCSWYFKLNIDLILYYSVAAKVLVKVSEPKAIQYKNSFSSVFISYFPLQYLHTTNRKILYFSTAVLFFCKSIEIILNKSFLITLYLEIIHECSNR